MRAARSCKFIVGPPADTSDADAEPLVVKRSDPRATSSTYTRYFGCFGFAAILRRRGTTRPVLIMERTAFSEIPSSRAALGGVIHRPRSGGSSRLRATVAIAD